MQTKRSIFVLFLLIKLALPAQDIQYARKVISKLCSPAFHGRGYAKKGEEKAAKFIRSELKSLKIKGFTDNYFQPFSHPINAFPSAMSIKINNKKLIPGADYLVKASSNSCKGTFKLLTLDSAFFADKDEMSRVANTDLSKYFVVIDTLGTSNPEIKEFVEAIIFLNPFNAAGIVEVVYTERLTYVPSTVRDIFPTIQIRKEVFREKPATIEVNIKSEFYKNYETQNVAAYIEGETDTFVVLSAHYDHLGLMGSKTRFPGAHDNASGVAMVLNLAKYLAERNKKPHYSVAFLFFSGEEAGLFGSKYYTEHPLFPMSKIKFLMNIDLVGSGEDGITVVNGSVFTEEFNKMVQINEEKQYLKTIKKRGAAANSDHYFFYENGVKCFFYYTLGAYKEYHNIYDTAEALPLNEFEDIFRLMRDYFEF